MSRTPEDTMDTKEQTPAEVVRQFVAAMDAGDVAAVDGLLDDAVTWQLMGDLSICAEVSGKQQLFEQLIGPVSSRFEPGTVRYELIDLYEDRAQSTAVVHWNERGDVQGGGRFDNHIMAAFRVSGGKIVAAKEFMDLRPVVQSLGLS
jgi:ketosteroid isomerase-like protein